MTELLSTDRAIFAILRAPNERIARAGVREEGRFQNNEHESAWALTRIRAEADEEEVPRREARLT